MQEVVCFFYSSNSSHNLVEIHPGEMDSLIDTTAGSQYNTHG
ncbi:hypothetical protein ES703_86040 [subsurface metagenome]